MDIFIHSTNIDLNSVVCKIGIFVEKIMEKGIIYKFVLQSFVRV
jgi:hypothetical protein